jgi:hypothetical protein
MHSIKIDSGHDIYKKKNFLARNQKMNFFYSLLLSGKLFKELSVDD